MYSLSDSAGYFDSEGIKQLQNMQYASLTNCLAVWVRCQPMRQHLKKILSFLSQ